MNVTTFKSRQNARPATQTTLAEVLADIKNGKWQARIEKVHQDIKHKDWLPAFTPTGTFSHRSIEGMEEYNGIICLDIDHIEDAEALREIARTLDYVHAAYVTPSGHGLKVIVKTNAIKECYTMAERVIARNWQTDTDTERDNRCKDIARIQYISYDPDLVYNEASIVVDIWPFYNSMIEQYNETLNSDVDPKVKKKLENALTQLKKEAGIKHG